MDWNGVAALIIIGFFLGFLFRKRLSAWLASSRQAKAAPPAVPAEIIPPAAFDQAALTSRLYELDKIFGPFGSNAAHPSDLYAQAQFTEALWLLTAPNVPLRPSCSLSRATAGRCRALGSRHFENAPKRIPTRSSACCGSASTTRHGPCISRWNFCSRPNRASCPASRSCTRGIGGPTIAGCRTSSAIIWISARGEATRRRFGDSRHLQGPERFRQGNHQEIPRARAAAICRPADPGT